MRLTSKLRQSIVVRFKEGFTVADIASWYALTPKRVEGAIRDWMVALDKLDKQEVASGS